MSGRCSISGFIFERVSHTITRMKSRRGGVVLACLVLAGAQSTPAESAPAQSISPSSATDDPRITIDGAKNPELIPDWAAWLEAFRFMALPAKPHVPIPTEVHLATTEQQRALIRKEALELIALETDLGNRGVKLQEGLNADNLAERTGKADALEMQRRQAALDARDRLCAVLPPDAQRALTAFAEHARRSQKVSVPKSKVEWYRLPH